MNNIWKYTLVFCFTIILDQLIKGSIQGFLDSGSQIEILPFLYFQESHFLKLSPPWNKILAYLALFSIIYFVKNVIIHRNKNFTLGLMRTFIMVGLFTVFLEQISLGYIVNYISVANLVNLSIGKLSLIIGTIVLLIANLKNSRVTT